MKIQFAITGPGGATIVAGGEHTDTDDLGAWSNHSSVVRLLRVANLAPGQGQKLVMWVEHDRRRWSPATDSEAPKDTVPAAGVLGRER